MSTSRRKHSTYREEAEIEHGVTYANGRGPFGLKPRRRSEALAARLVQWHQHVTRRGEATGYVYGILLHSNPQHLKIGRSKATLKRLAALKTDTPFAAELVMDVAVAHPDAAESALHDVFYNYWVSGEWFLLPKPKLDAVLQTMFTFKWQPLPAGQS